MIEQEETSTASVPAAMAATVDDADREQLEGNDPAVRELDIGPTIA